MPHFRIKAAARADLKSIAVFTKKTWGREQRNRYLAALDHAFQQLAENPELGQACDHIRAGYRLFPVGSHLMFYQLGCDRSPDIIRVLHT